MACRRVTRGTLCAACVVALAACTRPDQPARSGAEVSAHAAEAEPRAAAEDGECLPLDPGLSDSKPADRAVAVILPAEGSQVRGTVTFEETADGLRMVAEIHGLPPGKHGFHVHAYGDCSSGDFKSAGPHFVFDGSFTHQENAKEITGNLGELDPAVPRYEAIIEGASLCGRFGIIGRAIVIHELANDPSKPPDGGAGARIGCGVVGVGEP